MLDRFSEKIPFLTLSDIHPPNTYLVAVNALVGWGQAGSN